MNFIERLILKLIQHKVSRWFSLERSLTARQDSIGAVAESPEKTWPDPAKFNTGREIPFNLKNITVVGPHLRSCVHQGTRAIQTLAENPLEPQSTITPEILSEFEHFATSLGIGAIGYTKLPRRLIFQERAVMYDNVIVLLKEMDKEAIAKAPSVDTFKMVFQTYDSLGIAVNQLTQYLRQKGYGAQGGHPLGGLVLYPPLAIEAALGWSGRHGLLITPQFGPRQRIAAIFTNIENLPVIERNPHAWIEEFCAKCGRCIRTCPSKAIYEKPVIHDSGRKTHINRAECLPVFVDQQGCTVCIKECPFSKGDYQNLFEKHHQSKNVRQLS